MSEQRKSKVLVVDDEEVFIDLLVGILGENHEVNVAMDGESALNSVASNPPDIIILDVLMPGMDGYEVCLKFKGNEKTRDIPVIFITTLSDEEDEATGLNLGAVDFITKPICPELVKARVRNHLALKRYRDHLEELVRERTKELKESQALVVETEKMGALGTLTAGIAHELNNPLMGLINFIQYSRDKISQSNKAYEVLGDAEREAKRCIDIVKNLLTFSRIEKQEDERYQKIDITIVLDRIFKLLDYRLVKENINLTQYIEDEVPEIWIKTSNMQQVFLNIIGNALDALRDSERKELHIDVRPEDEFLQVTVKDTGPGISSENILKIFDPFFTTKPIGKGTGLGLSVSFGIVKDHGGEIQCESELGVGTTFKVLLPMKQRNERLEQ